jgi:HSP20 family protein
VAGEFDPLRDLLLLQERMNRLFEESLAKEARREPRLHGGAWTPAADVWETADTFVALVELPGVAPDDVVVEIDGRELRLRGERREGGPRPQRFERMERMSGAFSRVVRVGEDLDPDRVSAVFRDGLLRLEVAKLARPQWRPEPGEKR